MTIRNTLLAMATGAALLSPVVAVAADVDSAEAGQIWGYWKNPKGSVHVNIRPCGGVKACGNVVWATPKAQQDTREGGAGNLIGMQIIRELTLGEGGVWRGKVFAPDINMTFSGTARLDGTSKLRAKGCLIGGLLCKAQTWTRIATPQG